MIYENIKGVYRPVNTVISGGDHEINNKYENINGIYRKVFENGKYIIKNGRIKNPSKFNVINFYISGWGGTSSASGTFPTPPINKSLTISNSQSCSNTGKIMEEDGYTTFSITVSSRRATHNDVLEMRFYDERLIKNNYVEIIYKSYQQGRSSKIALDTFDSVNWRTSVNNIPYSASETKITLKILVDGYLNFVVATQHGDGTSASFSGTNSISINEIKIL